MFDYLNLPPSYLKKLEFVVETLVNNLSEEIEKILLFGSAARGKLVNESDLDFLVVPKNNINCRDLSLKIQCLDLREDVGMVPVDIVVRTESYLNSEVEFFSKMIRRDEKELWKNEL